MTGDECRKAISHRSSLVLRLSSFPERKLPTIKIGDSLPAGTLVESIGYDDGKNCPMPPQPVDITGTLRRQESGHLRPAGRVHAHLFGLARAGLPEEFDALKAKGVDAIVYHGGERWFRHGCLGPLAERRRQIRMLGDGSAAFTKALGLELDLTAKGMGVRCQRFSLLVENGVVKQVNVEGVGPANCSFAENMLAQLG